MKVSSSALFPNYRTFFRFPDKSRQISLSYSVENSKILQYLQLIFSSDILYEFDRLFMGMIKQTVQIQHIYLWKGPVQPC